MCGVECGCLRRNEVGHSRIVCDDTENDRVVRKVVHHLIKSE